MDSMVSLLLARAENEIIAAKVLNKLSENGAQSEELKISKGTTFYSSVISHSYFTIFYAAKAYLISRNVKVPEQGQHNAVYFMFKKFVKNGELDSELLIVCI